MAFKKRTTINYFQLVPKKETHSINDLSTQLSEIGDISFRPKFLNGKVFVISKPLRQEGSYFLGSVFHIQMANIPPKMSVDSYEMVGLDLSDFEGLAKATCFLLDPKANILVMEAGTGVTEKGLCDYLKFNSQMPKILPSVIINPGQIQKFYKMGSIFQFEAQMAVVNDGELFSNNQAESIRQITDSADGTNTDRLTYKIEISPKHRVAHKTLDKTKISNFIDRFLRFKDTEEIESLKVSGLIEGESRPVLLELIRERLHDTIEYQIEDRLIQSYNLEERLGLIEKSYGKHKEDILRTYKI